MSDYRKNIISEILESDCYETFLIKGNIIVTVVKPNSEIKIADARKNTELVIKISKGNKYPMLVDARKIKSIDKEARDHFSMRNREGKVNSIAILIGSPISVMVGNFFMGLNKPTVPTKLFSNSEKAIKWCLKQ